ncbi:MAG: SCO family protein [Burkholderiales bacterium]
MRTSNRSSVAAACLLGVAAISATHAGPARAHGVESHATDAGAAPAAPRSSRNRWGANYFPNAPLVTQDGTAVKFYDDVLKGKSVAINVIYTRCKDECPLEMARMVQLQRILGERMGKDIFFYSITIDPEHDTPEVLKAYRDRYEVGPGWQFLTGKVEDIKAVAKKLGLSRTADLINVDGHTASLMVGNEPSGRWMRNSAVDNPPFLASTIGNFLGWRNMAPQKSYAQARPLALDKGEYIFQARCASCHTIGKGDAMGPDLQGVTARRERAWLARYIQVPDRMLAARDPIALGLFEKYTKTRMPNLGLGATDVVDLISYLESRAGAPRRQAVDSSASH